MSPETKADRENIGDLLKDSNDKLLNFSKSKNKAKDHIRQASLDNPSNNKKDRPFNENFIKINDFEPKIAPDGPTMIFADPLGSAIEGRRGSGSRPEPTSFDDLLQNRNEIAKNDEF